MSRYRKQNFSLNSVISVIATLLIGYFVLCAVILPFAGSMDNIGEITTDLVELLPFGEQTYGLAISILNTVSGQTLSYHAIEGSFTLSYLIQELAESLIIIIVYEALRLVSFKFMEITDDVSGKYNKMKKLIVSVIMAIIATCLAPLLIKNIFDNMSGLTSGWQVAISALVPSILFSGGTAFFVFLYGISIGLSLVYILVKFFVVGGLRLFGCYIFIFLTVLALQYGNWSLLAASLPSLLVLILLLTGLELMIDSLVK